jgi:hypothetical protein
MLLSDHPYKIEVRLLRLGKLMRSEVTEDCAVKWSWVGWFVGCEGLVKLYSADEVKKGLGRDVGWAELQDL